MSGCPGHCGADPLWLDIIHPFHCSAQGEAQNCSCLMIQVIEGFINMAHPAAERISTQAQTHRGCREERRKSSSVE